MGMVDQLDVKENKLTTKELKCIIGGINFSGSVISALQKIYESLYGYGQSFGKTLRKFIRYKKCKI